MFYVSCMTNTKKKLAVHTQKIKRRELNIQLLKNIINSQRSQLDRKKGTRKLQKSSKINENMTLVSTYE